MPAFEGKIWCTGAGKRTPAWETYLEDASESIIRETGLSRRKLKEVLEILHEYRIIN